MILDKLSNSQHKSNNLLSVSSKNFLTFCFFFSVFISIKDCISFWLENATNTRTFKGVGVGANPHKVVYEVFKDALIYLFYANILLFHWRVHKF